MRDYYEELWERLPETVVPADLERRASFLLERVCDGQRVLDLGCGDGTFAELILEHAQVELTLAEVAQAALARAQARPRLGSRASYVQVPFDGPLPLSDNTFDLIWAGEVIEHVADTANWLSEVRRVLAPGGRLLLSTPNHTRPALAWRGIGAYSPPLGDHLHLYNRGSLSELLEEFAFAEVQVRAAGRLGPLSGRLLASARR